MRELLQLGQPLPIIHSGQSLRSASSGAA
jgi:hypothetical protein